DTSKVGTYTGTVSFGTNDASSNPFAFTLTGTVSNTAIADDGDATGFGTVGTWFPYSGQGYHNNVHFAASGTGSNVATWTFNVAPGQYRVSATWSTDPNRATNSPYTVLDGTTPLGTVPVNQQLAPSDRIDSGVGWKDLGTFTVTGTSLV